MLAMVAPDLPEDGEVVVVAQVAGLDVRLVEEVVVADLVAPDLLDVGILQLLGQSFLDVVVDFVEVLGDGDVDLDDLVSHGCYI